MVNKEFKKYYKIMKRNDQFELSLWRKEKEKEYLSYNLQQLKSIKEQKALSLEQLEYNDKKDETKNFLMQAISMITLFLSSVVVIWVSMVERTAEIQLSYANKIYEQNVQISIDALIKVVSDAAYDLYELGIHGIGICIVILIIIIGAILIHRETENNKKFFKIKYYEEELYILKKVIKKKKKIKKYKE